MMLTPDVQSKLLRECSFLFGFIRVSAWLSTCIVSVPFRFTMEGPSASGFTLVQDFQAIDGPMQHPDPNRVRRGPAGQVLAICCGSCRDEYPVNDDYWCRLARIDLERRKDVLDERLWYYAWWCLQCEGEYRKTLAGHS